MLKKKMKGVSVVSSGVVPIGPSSSYAFDEEARARFQHQSLGQDFAELQMENEARRRKLQVLHRRKLVLSAEVRFLKRRYKYLKKIRSLEAQSASPDLGRPQVPEIHREVALLPRPKPFPSLDLNQISNGDELEAAATVDFQFLPEPTTKADKYPKKHFLNGSNEPEPCQYQQQQQQQQQSEMKLSVCRGVPNGSNRSGKRKITWQDQVALRV